ncbi:DUF1631 family protein [Aquabacterium sp.]|uniref:DUF1631 family protein n=1 Tax=Aquabacterium sp. TaxID=1872578 RepID=UPI0035AF1B8F
MTAPGPLQRFVEDALTHAPRWLHDVSQDALQALLDSHNPALVSHPREAVGQAVIALQGSSRRLIDGFVVELRQRIDSAMDESRGHAARTLGNDINSWSLVDADEAEQDIEVLRAIQLAENQAEAELQELMARTSTLRGDATVRPDANPIRPEVIARALWASIQTLGLTSAARLALMRAISQPLAARLKTVYADALRQLEAWGVRPAAYRAVLTPSAGREADPPHSGFDVTRPGAFDDLRAAAWQARGGAQAPVIAGTGAAQVWQRTAGPGVGGFGGSPGGGTSAGAAAGWERLEGHLLSLNGPGGAVLSSQAQARLDAVLQQLTQDQRQQEPGAWTPPSGQPAPPAENLIRAHESALLAAARHDQDREVVALLAQLFDKILTDPRLLPEVRAVLGRLQASVLGMALSDTKLLDDYHHPTWQLLNLIASHTLGYTQAHDARLRAFLAALDTPIHELVTHVDADPQAHERALKHVQALIDEQLRSEREQVADVIDKLHVAAARNQLAPLIHQEVVAQLVGVELDDDLRRFFYGPWVRAAATQAALEGEAGAAPYLDTIEQLVASLRPPGSVSERAQLLQRIPKVARLLRESLEALKLPEGEREALLGSLMAHHHDLLSRPLRPADAPAELSPEDIVQRLRDEPDYHPATPAGAAPTVFDLASLDTVPAALLDQAHSSDHPAAPWLQRAQPGTWVELFSGGSWVRVRLLWQSDDGEHWVFGGPAPGQARALTRRALQRLVDERLANALEARNLVERAVDALLADIAQRSNP